MWTTALHGSYNSMQFLSSTSLTNNTMRTLPILFRGSVTVDALAVFVINTNAGASAVVRLSLYQLPEPGRPILESWLLADGGTASINASGVKTMLLPRAVRVRAPGCLVAATFQDLDTAGSNPTIQSCQSNPYLAGGLLAVPSVLGTAGGQYGADLIVTGISGNPPNRLQDVAANVSLSQFNTSVGPAVAVRFEAAR